MILSYYLRMKCDVFIMGDQPTTCPICGTRTDIIKKYPDGSQYHQCMAENCKFEFMVVEQ